jgi:SagB-type dehydrogenase family enzyme
LPAATLIDVLARRVSARGALAGPLTAPQLGTLLWSATAGHIRRPYPSAGALYTAGIRLVVFDVTGLAPGCYRAVPEHRALDRIGPVPATADVHAMSPYLSRPLDDPYAVGVDDAPAILGLYVDLGLLRGRYGLRALRLGLLEAGHLAHSLILVATALGLSSTPINGFNDELCHQLFGLDDIDEPLQYLLPIGRAGGPSDPSATAARLGWRG